MCDNYNMEQTQTQTDQSRSIASLTDELLEDLINPSLSALEMCQIYQLTLVELATILESESFKQAAGALARIASARQTIIEPEARALATARLCDILKDKPSTPAHAETQRKAAMVILKGVPTAQSTPKPEPQAASNPVRRQTALHEQQSRNRSRRRTTHRVLRCRSRLHQLKQLVTLKAVKLPELPSFQLIPVGLLLVLHLLGFHQNPLRNKQAQSLVII